MPKRSYKINPWHNCPCCGIKTHISDMEWERGILKCSRVSCKDERLIGQRDIEIAKILQQPTKELQPDQKLLAPSPVTMDEVIF